MAIVVLDGGAGAKPIQIEVSGASDGDVSDFYADEATRALSDKVVKLARPLFAEAVDLVKACAVEVWEKLDDLPDEKRPDQIELQFAVKLDAKVGASIAEAATGAQLQVCLRWNHKDHG